MFKSIFVSPIIGQIDEYLVYKALRAPTMVQIEQPYLNAFVRLVKVRHVSDITVEHVVQFNKHLRRQLSTDYAYGVATRSIRGFLRYHHRKGHLCPSAKAVRSLTYPQAVS